MTVIRQYRPGFVDAEEPLLTAEFETKEQLFAIPFVARFADPELGKPWETTAFTNQGNGRWTEEKRVYSGLPPFHQFSFTDTGAMPTLIAEYDGGRRWFVVGFLSRPIDFLPAWEPKK